MQGEKEGIKLEYETFYQSLKLIGLKFERARENIENFQNYYITSVGFRHETYKYYFLLRGLKRMLENMVTKKERPDEFVILDEANIIQNYEILKFFGEEVKWGDPIFKKGLREVLKQEKKTPESQSKLSFGKRINRAAVTMSILVAGDYQFYEEDLSNLVLTGANMRGGMFFGSSFENTDLQGANLWHCNLKSALFKNSDLRKIELGILPDFQNHDAPCVTCIDWSPSGDRLASGSQDKNVKVWNGSSGECLTTLRGHANRVSCVCWNLEGKKLASGSWDKSIKTWNLTSNACEVTLKDAHKKHVSSVCWMGKENKIISGGGDYSVKIWSLESKECVAVLLGHENDISSLSLTKNGKKLVSGSWDFSAIIWNLDNKAQKIDKQLKGHEGEVTSVCWNASGDRVVTASGDKTIKIWNASNGNCDQTLKGHNNKVTSVDWNGHENMNASNEKMSNTNEKIASCSWDKSLKL